MLTATSSQLGSCWTSLCPSRTIVMGRPRRPQTILRGSWSRVRVQLPQLLHSRQRGRRWVRRLGRPKHGDNHGCQMGHHLHHRWLRVQVRRQNPFSSSAPPGSRTLTQLIALAASDASIFSPCGSITAADVGLFSVRGAPDLLCSSTRKWLRPLEYLQKSRSVPGALYIHAYHAISATRATCLGKIMSTAEMQCSHANSPDLSICLSNRLPFLSSYWHLSDTPDFACVANSASLICHR